MEEVLDSQNANIEQRLTRRTLRPKFRRIGEFYIWTIIATAIIFPAFYDVLYYGDFRIETVRDNISSLSLATVVLLFPILFNLIFNAFPLEILLRSQYKSDADVSNIRQQAAKPKTYIETEDVLESMRVRLESMRVNAETPDNYLLSLAISSRKLAKTIFSRAGVFLLIGGLFAVSGLMFFYLNTPTFSEVSAQEHMLLALAKNIGILFFIEFIAFFFLRQYRSAMDEFRYYESLQRSREETFAIVKLLRENDEKVDVYQLIEKCGFRSNIDKLETGQSTELLESKKLNRDETEIFHKILNILGRK